MNVVFAVYVAATVAVAVVTLFGGSAFAAGTWLEKAHYFLTGGFLERA